MPDKCLVIVESPTKANTIRKFLPKSFMVEASMGHVRDLPQSASAIPAKYKGEAWAKIGVNVENDFEPLYVVPKGKSKIIRELKTKLKDASELYLATDEDREGESISWHLIQILKPKVPVKRMVFHEITKDAITAALDKTREIDPRLVQAQETRRILDRLVGYTLSPLIWKKIAFGLSAGRVQSAGLRMIVARERRRLHFKKAEYWDLKATLEKDEQKFDARLVAIDGKNIASGKDFEETTGKPIEGKDIVVVDEARAKSLTETLKNKPWEVVSIQKKDSKSRPLPPFITSTLQQESNRKLGLSARDTMRVAQSLYEQGLITYMRTDSPALSQQAISGARAMIQSLYGKDYLSEKPKQYTSKSKGAQEAHEAIRPAGESFKVPKESGLSGKQLALYELIWKRAIASQMADAQKASMTVKIQSENATFTATGMKITFPGFLKVYAESAISGESLDQREVLLPDLNEGDKLNLDKIEPVPHETKPAARYNEASLVQRLEKEGIGRPSTYASIISTIVERGYVRKVSNALVPTFTGLVVVQLLERYFEDLVDYSFTSSMEQSLDEIAEGNRESLPYLKSFYLGKSGLLSQVEEQEKKIDPDTSRTVDLFPIEGLSIKVGRFGPYIVKESSNGSDNIRASIPEEIAPADLTEAMIDEIVEASEKGPQPLGKHPDTGQNIYCLLGRYGPYVQLGEAEKDGPKPKRASVPRGMNYRELTLDQAVKLLSLPRQLGKHPETGEMIEANNGRFGPYVRHQSDFRSLKKEDNVYTVTFERAMELFAEEKKGRRGSKLVREVGQHPETQKRIYLYEGKYGVYIKFGSKNFSLPDGVKHEELKIEQAVEIVDAGTKKKTPKAKSKTKSKSKSEKSKSTGKS